VPDDVLVVLIGNSVVKDAVLNDSVTVDNVVQPAR
jgi:hypothetical protein